MSFVLVVAAWLALVPPQGYDEALAAAVAAIEAGDWEPAEASARRASELAPDEISPRLLLGRIYLATGRAGLALDALESLPEPAASEPAVRCLEGRALSDLGRYDEAIATLEAAVAELDDEDLTCREALGVARLEAGDASGAAAELEAVARALPEARSPSFDAAYGMALAQAGRHADAIEPLRASLRLQPMRARVRFHLGRSLQALERFEDAVQVYEGGLNLPPPENVRFAVGLVRCEIRLERWTEAREHLDRLLEEHPRAALPWLLRGIVAFEEREYEASVRYIERARELGYQRPESDLRLGMALGMLGRYDEAQRSLDAALTKEPELATALYYKGLFLFQEGESLAPGSDNPFGQHAARLLERSLELVPGPATSAALAEAYLRLGQHQRAIEAARRAVEVPELAPRAHHVTALAHHELLEYEPAETNYREALEAGGDSAELYHDLGNLLSVMGRSEEAKLVLEKALARDPGLGGALVQLGVVLANLGEHEAALDSLRRAIETLPENAEAWYQRGVVESREGDAEAAVESWKRALAIDPDQPRLYYRLGAELVKLGRLDERNEMLTEFAKRERETELAAQQSEQLQNLLGGAVAAADAKEDERALALMEEARALAPDKPLPIVYLGDFHLSRGNLDLAESVLREGIERLPHELSLYQTLLAVQQAAGEGAAADETRRRIRALVTGSN